MLSSHILKPIPFDSSSTQSEGRTTGITGTTAISCGAVVGVPVPVILSAFMTQGNLQKDATLDTLVSLVSCLHVHGLLCFSP